MMLALPLEVVAAPSPISPESDKDNLTFWDPPDVLAGLVESPPSTAPWFRNTFVAIRVDAKPLLGSTDAALPAKTPATAEKAPAKVAVPGTVQNVRRADGS
jgi:hypothetical protein